MADRQTQEIVGEYTTTTKVLDIQKMMGGLSLASCPNFILRGGKNLHIMRATGPHGEIIVARSRGDFNVEGHLVRQDRYFAVHNLGRPVLMKMSDEIGFEDAAIEQRDVDLIRNHREEKAIVMANALIDTRAQFASESDADELLHVLHEAERQLV